MKDFEQFMQDVKVELEESSLNRLASKAKKKGIGYVSAERGDKSKKENKERSKQLAKDIRGQGLPGPTKVDGQYIENDGSKEGRKVSERSYAVSSGKKGKRKFKKSMEKLGKKYDQDSVLVQKKPGGEGKLTATNKGGKKDLKGWDGKVGKMKPGGTGEIQTGIKKKTFTYEEFATENYGDDKYHPDKLSKDLPKDYKYGNEQQGKGDHKTRTLQHKGTDTDVKIGGASKGTKHSYSPSWKDGHNKAKKLLKNIDKEIDGVKKSGPEKDTAKRMAKGYEKNLQTKANKVISDITGKGRKTNPQGKGSKAARRLK